MKATLNSTVDFFVPMGEDPEDGYWLRGTIEEIRNSDVTVLVTGPEGDYEIGHRYSLNESDIFEPDNERFNFNEELTDEDIEKLAISDLFPDDKYTYGIRSSQARFEIALWVRGYKFAKSH